MRTQLSKLLRKFFLALEFFTDVSAGAGVLASELLTACVLGILFHSLACFNPASSLLR